MIYVLLFAIAYALKGGALEKFKNYERARENSRILKYLLNAKFLSCIPVLFAGLIYMSEPWHVPAILAAWVIAIAPSVGEEHGAIGYFTTRFWSLYDNRKEALIGCFVELDHYEVTKRGRLYDVKKAFQRGVWMGAAMTVATGNIIFIPLSLLFVPIVFIGQTLNRMVLRRDGWTIAEPLVGAVLFGVGFWL